MFGLCIGVSCYMHACLDVYVFVCRLVVFLLISTILEYCLYNVLVRGSEEEGIILHGMWVTLISVSAVSCRTVL